MACFDSEAAAAAQWRSDIAAVILMLIEDDNYAFSRLPSLTSTLSCGKNLQHTLRSFLAEGSTSPTAQMGCGLHITLPHPRVLNNVATSSSVTLVSECRK